MLTTVEKRVPGVLAAILAASLLVACEREPVQSADPPRPTNVPAAALWVGGLDGGVFVLVRKRPKSARDIYDAEIRYVSGDLAYRGPMKTHPPETTFDPTKRESFEGWDGTRLFLGSGRYLEVGE